MKKAGKPKKRSREPVKSRDSFDLHDDGFDYEEFVAREFGKVPHRALGIKWYWWLLGVAILAGMIASVFWLG